MAENPGGGTMKRILVRLAAIFLIAFSAQAFSQTNSTISGIVQDRTRALIPGVTITLTDERTGDKKTTFTNESGGYRFTGLAPGLFTVTAELSGFRTKTYNDVAVAPGAEVKLEFTLEVGAFQPFNPFPYHPPDRRDRNVEIAADRTTREGLLIHYRGHVEMTTDEVIVHADELDWDTRTQQADVRGNVTVKVLPPTLKVTPLASN
jgi:hypothetical protein